MRTMGDKRRSLRGRVAARLRRSNSVAFNEDVHTVPESPVRRAFLLALSSRIRGAYVSRMNMSAVAVARAP